LVELSAVIDEVLIQNQEMEKLRIALLRVDLVPSSNRKQTAPQKAAVAAVITPKVAPEKPPKPQKPPKPKKPEPSNTPPLEIQENESMPNATQGDETGKVAPELQPRPKDLRPQPKPTKKKNFEE